MQNQMSIPYNENNEIGLSKNTNYTSSQIQREKTDRIRFIIKIERKKKENKFDNKDITNKEFQRLPHLNGQCKISKV